MARTARSGAANSSSAMPQRSNVSHICARSACPVARLQSVNLPESPSRSYWELYGHAVLTATTSRRSSFRPDQRRCLARCSTVVLTPRHQQRRSALRRRRSPVGLRQQVSFDGQAALSLETTVDRAVTDAYRFEFRYVDGATNTDSHQTSLILDWQPMVEAILDDLGHGLEPARSRPAFIMPWSTRSCGSPFSVAQSGSR